MAQLVMRERGIVRYQFLIWSARGCSHTTRARRDTDSNFHGQFGYRSAAHASGRFGG